jgi:hypothetical protein
VLVRLDTVAGGARSRLASVEDCCAERAGDTCLIRPSTIFVPTHRIVRVDLDESGAVVEAADPFWACGRDAVRRAWAGRVDRGVPPGSSTVRVGVGSSNSRSPWRPRDPDRRGDRTPVGKSVNAVVAPVTVRDEDGRIVSEVPRNRFHLYVDGMEVPIRDFARESDLPLSLGFILDSSGSMAGRKLAACQDLIHAFLEERRQDDQLALWTFGDDRGLERFPFGMGWYLLPGSSRPSGRGARPRSTT